MDNNTESFILNRFRILEQIGQGSFCIVYHAIDTKTKRNVALKKNISSEGISSVILESEVLKKINSPAFPKVICSGRQGKFYYIAMELLGSSLGKILKENNRKLPLGSVLKIGIHMLNILEELHNKGFLHRDIKPENILLGRKTTQNEIYLIDYGFCKIFRSQSFGSLNIYKEGVLFQGNYAFCSMNSLVGISYSCRDDIESLSYLLIYLYHGRLPWHNEFMTAGNLLSARLNSQIPIIFKDTPDILSYILNYSKALNFNIKPNYEMLRKKIKEYTTEQSIDIILPLHFHPSYYAKTKTLAQPRTKSFSTPALKMKKINCIASNSMIDLSHELEKNMKCKSMSFISESDTISQTKAKPCKRVKTIKANLSTWPHMSPQVRRRIEELKQIVI